MKTCPVCLDSVDARAASCPSCGEKFFVAQAQPIANAGNQQPIVRAPQPKPIKPKNKINPLIRLYSLVFVAIAVLGVGSTIALSNNSGESSTPDPSQTNQQEATESSEPEPEIETGVLKASTLLAKLTKAGVCDDLGIDITSESALYFKDDLMRWCLVPASTQTGGETYNSIDKYITIYTGVTLSKRFAEYENLRVFEAAIIGDGWTVVANYYPSNKKSYLDDPDIKEILKLLGGRIIAKD